MILTQGRNVGTPVLHNFTNQRVQESDIPNSVEKSSAAPCYMQLLSTSKDPTRKSAHMFLRSKNRKHDSKKHEPKTSLDKFLPIYLRFTQAQTIQKATSLTHLVRRKHGWSQQSFQATRKNKPKTNDIPYSSRTPAALPFAQCRREPVQPLVQSVSLRGARSLNVPLTIA